MQMSPPPEADRPTETSGVRRRILLLIMAFAIAVSGIYFFSLATTNRDSHKQMLTLLQEIKDETPEKNSYLGDAALNDLLADLETADDPVEQVNLNVKASLELLNLGRIDEAVERVDQSVRLLKDLEKQPAEGKSLDEVKRHCLFHAAVAHLRRGETENCVCAHNPDSCILPIQGNGVHANKRGSKQAVVYLTELLQVWPQHSESIWLLNVAHMTLGTYPDEVPAEFRIAEEKFRSREEFPRFFNIASTLGVNALDLSGGVVVDDFDNDGFLDLLTSTWDTAGELRYFHNEGNGKFTERTQEAGLTGLFGGLNMVQADYDNDGDIDVLVLRGAWLKDCQYPNSLLRNDGQGNFEDVTFSAGLAEVHAPTQTAAWADYDLDGDIDLYIGNENTPCQFFENRGDGTFEDVTSRAGVANGGYTKAVVFGDYNQDRYPDIYVSNLEGNNRLYRNLGNGSFRDVAEQLNVTKPKRGFPAWFWDFNNDGVLDIYASSYNVGVGHIANEYLEQPIEAEGDCLYQGQPGGSFFVEVAVPQGLDHVTQPMGSNFGDLNNDGFPDFYLGTGYPGYEGLMPNLMYLNRGGESFADVTIAGGFGSIQKGHGVAFADVDNDGDQDVFIQMGGAYPGDAFGNVLFHNPGFGKNWIKLRLVGVECNRFGVGCRIRVDVEEDGEIRSIYKWVNSGGSFGCKPLRQEIGLGSATEIASLQIYWPRSDRTQTFQKVPVNQYLEVVEGDADYRQLPLKKLTFDIAEPQQDSVTAVQ